jgi:hypothetical protein
VKVANSVFEEAVVDFVESSRLSNVMVLLYSLLVGYILDAVMQSIRDFQFYLQSFILFNPERVHVIPLKNSSLL